MVLDSEFGMAPSLTKWAKKKNLKNALVFGVNSGETYLLVINGKAEYESEVAEHIAFHIDFLALSENV